MAVHIFPTPKQCVFHPGTLSTDRPVRLSMAPSIRSSCLAAGCDPEEHLKNIFPAGLSADGIPVSVTSDPDIPDLPPDGFVLSIDADAIHIACRSGSGFFYAVNVLYQLAAQGEQALPCLYMADWPALSIRGILLDIARDKIPTMETLCSLIDMFALMRLNHLQLYMEGFCYNYEEYRYLFTDETPLTPEEFQKLSAYAKARFIDLVPCQNVLGHMGKWLDKPQFHPLAECEDGYIFKNLYWRPPATLDVKNPESFRLVVSLLNALTERSDSRYLNVNMDEPFELGMGKNKAFAENYGRSELYLEYLSKIYGYCTEKKKTMMIWGDELMQHPEHVSRIPEDIILLDWLYESEGHFKDHARLLQEMKRPFCLCPGTSCWASLTGRSDNMIANIEDAVACAVQYGGLGVITTDWGDMGHWQYQSASFPAFAYTAFLTWNGPSEDKSPAEWYCNRFIYKDSNERAFKAALDLGNYYRFEHAPLYSTTLAFAVMCSKYVFHSREEFSAKMEQMLAHSASIAKTNHIQPKENGIHIDFPAMQSYLETVALEIESLTLAGPDGALIKQEMKNGLRMVKHGIHLYYTMTELADDTELFQKEMKILYQDLNEILPIHFQCWTARNRLGGFSRSIKQINHLLTFYYNMSRGQKTEVH